MNAQTLAKMAYSAPSQPMRSPRTTEYELFSRITRDLRSAISKGPANFPDLLRCLHENRRLWAALAMEVADGDNRLPGDLRARLFYLGEFTAAHTSKVIAGKASADILVEINTSVMRGLQQTGAFQ